MAQKKIGHKSKVGIYTIDLNWLKSRYHDVWYRGEGLEHGNVSQESCAPMLIENKDWSVVVKQLARTSRRRRPAASRRRIPKNSCRASLPFNLNITPKEECNSRGMQP